MSAERYVRNRRLAYGVALAVLLLLTLYLLAGWLPDLYGRPALLAENGALTILHDAARGNEQDQVQIALTLDPATLKPRARVPLFGTATAIAPGPTIFYGNRAARLDESAVRELPMRWAVRAAALDGDQLWLAGVDTADGKSTIRACTSAGVTGPEEVAAEPDGPVEQLALTSSPSGLTVAWKERDVPRVRLVRRIDGRWRPLETIELGAAVRWTTAQVGPRQLVISFVREDRAWRSATFRIACCKACGLAPPPERWTFVDPLVLGRYLTGLAAAPTGDRLLLCVTRTSSVQVASIPLETLTPAPGARLAAVPLGFPWPQAVILLWLMAMLCLALTLVYLGMVLMRERQRSILAALGTRIPAGPKPAGFFAWLMALLIDYVLLVPLELFALEALDVAPAAEVSFDGPTLRLLACVMGAQIAYFILLEALFGRTLGKRIIALRVARIDGSRAGLLQVVVRNLLRITDVFLPTMVVTSLVLMVVTARRQRLGDLVAQTVVLEDDPGIEPESPEAVSLRKVLERAVQRAKERERK